MKRPECHILQFYFVEQQLYLAYVVASNIYIVNSPACFRLHHIAVKYVLNDD